MQAFMLVPPLAPRRLAQENRHEESQDRSRKSRASPAVAAEDNDGSSSSSLSSFASSTSPQDEIAMDISPQKHATSYADNDATHESLDQIATRTEERGVMRRLLRDIETAEEATRNTPLHPTSLVSAVSYPMESTVEEESDSITERSNWKTPSSLPRHRVTPWGRKRSRKKIGSKTRRGQMDNEVTIKRRTIRRSLPRLIADELGFYEDGPPLLLFTRPQFVQKVIIEAEKRIHLLGREHQEWNATLSDGNPNRPESYRLEASGTEDALEIVMDITERFVRHELERNNLEELVEDGASLVVNVKCSIDPKRRATAQKVLGAIFSSAPKKKATEGVYIKRIKPKGTLAKALGNPDVFRRGCALLAVNGTKVSNLSQVQELVMESNYQFPSPRTSAKIELSICLSKFSDLTNGFNVSKWNIHRRDGIPYDEEDYETFRLHKYMEGVEKKAIYQSKMKSKPMEKEDLDDDDDDDDDEELSSSSEESVQSLPKARKRRKRERIEASSSLDSDSTFDTRSSVQAESSDEDLDKKPKAKRKKIPSVDSSTKQRGASSPGYAIFRQFEEKLKPLILLDYKDTKINIKSVFSSMWKKHKELFGEDERCDDNCKCLMWLPEMTEDVIKDHIKKQNKKNVPVESEEQLERLTRGIAKNFVPKFITRLKDEYPEEGESQLVHRLVGMWEMHQRNRLYGVRCEKTCGCLAEWDQIFGKGDRAAAKRFISMMKRATLLSKSVSSSSTQAEATASSSTRVQSGPAVPRKKRVQDQVSRASNGLSKKPKLSGLISSISSRESIFEVAFESAIPLGAYFKTRNNQCQIYSLFLKGQMIKDSRISNGTTVMSVKIGDGAPIAISSHYELQKLYTNATKTWDTIYISFGKLGIALSSNNNSRVNSNFWNDSGQWVGTPRLNEEEGWAGGAMNAPPKSKVPKKPKEKAPLNMLVQKIARDSTQNIPEKELPPRSNPEDVLNVSIEEWTTIVNTQKPGHKNREPLKTLLVQKSSFPPEEPKEEKGLLKLLHPSMKKSKRERTHSKKLTFSIPNNEEIFFCKDDAPNVRRILQIKNKAQPKQTFQILDPEQDLINAIHNKSCSDVLHVLQSQELLMALSQGSLDLQALLQKEYTFLKRKDPVMAEKNDLRAKQKVLNIYINCIHLIEKTLALKKWYALTMEVKFIDLQHQSSIVDLIGGNVTMRLDDGNIKEDLVSYLLFLEILLILAYLLQFNFECKLIMFFYRAHYLFKSFLSI